MKISKQFQDTKYIVHTASLPITNFQRKTGGINNNIQDFKKRDYSMVYFFFFEK
jgi:hypothetical protein